MIPFESVHRKDRVSKQGKKNPLAGLELPGIERQLETVGTFPVEKITLEGVKCTVRAFNPRPKERRACYVCGRHRAVSQSHHVIEIGKVAKVLRAMVIYAWAPNKPIVALCPNHHAYEHAIRRVKSQVPPVLSDALAREVSEHEWDRLIELDDMRAEAHARVWEEVRREFLRREAAYRRAGQGAAR